MAGKITIPIIRDVSYEVGDRVELEIDSAVQPDRIYIWPDETARDAVVDGDTIAPVMHQTLVRFPAGDYNIRLRGIDVAGNPGDWSAATTIEHRPTPDAPESLAIDGDNLTGTWTDD